MSDEVLCKCKTDNHNGTYCPRWDSIYCKKCALWSEPKCLDKERCSYCLNRPNTPKYCKVVGCDCR